MRSARVFIVLWQTARGKVHWTEVTAQNADKALAFILQRYGRRRPIAAVSVTQGEYTSPWFDPESRYVVAPPPTATELATIFMTAFAGQFDARTGKQLVDSEYRRIARA